MGNLINALVEETKAIARTAEVRRLAEKYFEELKSVGLEPEAPVMRATSFEIACPLKWDVENSHFEETLWVRLYQSAKEEEIDFGRLELKEEALLKAILESYPAEGLVGRVFEDDCGCKTVYSVAILSREPVGDVVAEPAWADYKILCYQHDRDC